MIEEEMEEWRKKEFGKIRINCFLKTKTAIGTGYVVEKFIGIFADEWLFVITSDVVPRDTIVVDVVENGHAGFGGTVDVEFSVVGLSRLFVTRLRPWIVTPAIWRLICRCHLLAIRRPEPSVKCLWLEIATVLATFEITETTGSPDVRHVVWKKKHFF